MLSEAPILGCCLYEAAVGSLVVVADEKEPIENERDERATIPPPRSTPTFRPV